MSWQPEGEPPGGSGSGSGDPSLDETRTDWPLSDAGPEAPPPPPAPSAPGAGEPVPPAFPPPAADATTPPPAGSYQQGLAPEPPAGTWAPPGGYAPGGPYPGGGYPGSPDATATLQYASTPARFVAYLVDGFILGVIGWALALALAVVGLNAYDFGWVTASGSFGDGIAPLYPSDPEYATDLAALAIYAAIAAAISAAYFILQWSSGARATLGMRLFKLQLGNATDGQTLTRTQAAKRWLALGGWASLASIVPPIGTAVSGLLLLWELVLLLTVVNSPTRQGVHDRFAGSAMVQPPGGSGNALVVGCLLLVGAAVVITLISFVALIFLGAQVSEILSTVGDSI